jgi:hypothetical protein
LSGRPLEQDDVFDHQYVVHGDSEYAENKVPANTCVSLRRWGDGGFTTSRIRHKQIDLVSQSSPALAEHIP